MYIPEGFGTVFPYFIVTDAVRFTEFLNNAFDAREIGRSVMPNGRVANIRVGIGTSNFMVSEEQEGLGATKGVFYIYVEDADRTFDRALSLGAQKIMAPMDMPYRALTLARQNAIDKGTAKRSSTKRTPRKPS